MADRDDEHEDDDESTGETTATPAPVTATRARPVRKRVIPPDDPRVPVSHWGSVPARVTHWSCTKRGVNGEWTSLGWSPPGSGVELREWPLTELSDDTIRQRWGPGVYRCGWYGPNGSGGRSHLGRGREVTILPLGVAAPIEPPTDALGPGFAQAVAVMDMIERRANTQLTSIAQLATVLASRGGPDPEVLALRAQLEAQRQAETDQRFAALLSEVRALRTEMYEPDDGAETETPAAAPKRERPAFRAGDSVWDTLKERILNAALQNPEKALSVVGTVMQQIATIQKTPQQAPPAPEAPRAKPLPRATPRAPRGPGLNESVSQSSSPLGTPSQRGPGLNGYKPEEPPPEVPPLAQPPVPAT